MNASSVLTSAGQPSLHKTGRRIKGQGVFNLNAYIASNSHIYYGIVSPAISVIVILVNVLLIATLIKGKFRKSTHVVMIAIAIADCLTGLVPLPFNIYVFSLDKETEYLTLAWCYIRDYMQMFLPGIFHTSSLHLTIGLGIERFIVVAFPLKAKKICTIRNGIILSVIIFVLSVCFQIDLFTQVSFQEYSIKSNISNKTTNGCIRSPRIRTNIEYILREVFLIFLPCLILIIFTILLLKKSKEIQRWRKKNSSIPRQNSSTTKSLERLDLAVVLILFFVVMTEVTVRTCFILSRVYNIRFTTRHEELLAVGHIVFQITCPINFAILCFLSANFRQTFKRLFCCCFSRVNCNYFCNKDKSRDDDTAKITRF